ncbi:hypothetical protein HDU76_001377, partial [Blyttiomyces sp. JEL0837]
KNIEPTRALKQHEKLEKWAELITAGMIYYDFSNALNDTIKPTKFINKKVDPPDTVDPVDPLERWLRPVEVSNDLVKFKNDYVPGTRKWAVHNVHRWLVEYLNSLLWLNGGAGSWQIYYRLLGLTKPGFNLGSAFFCKHDDVNKNKAERIISTIAFDLASKLPEYHEFLMKEMKADDEKVAKGEPSILVKPSIAFTELLINGLQDIQPPSSHLVIIIDALDEIGKQCDPVRDEFLGLIRYQVEKLPR